MSTIIAVPDNHADNYDDNCDNYDDNHYDRVLGKAVVHLHNVLQSRQAVDFELPLLDGSGRPTTGRLFLRVEWTGPGTGPGTGPETGPMPDVVGEMDIEEGESAGCHDRT